MKTFDFFKNYLFIFWLHWVFVVARAFSLVATSEGYFLVVVCRLLTAVAALVMEHRISGAQAQ